MKRSITIASTFNFLANAPIFNLLANIVTLVSLCVVFYAVYLAITTDTKVEDTKNLANSNSEQIAESVKAASSASEAASNASVAASNASVAASNAVVLVENNAKLIVDEGKKTREVITEDGRKTREVYNEGVREIVGALDGIASILTDNQVVDEQQTEKVDPTYYLETPEEKTDKEKLMYIFENGALVLSYPENSNVYEILDAFSNEIGKLAPQNKPDLVIVPGKYDKNHAQKIQAVTENFPDMEIVAIPINKDSEVFLPLWQVISKTAPQKRHSDSELNAEGGTTGTVKEVSYASPLTVVFPK